MDVMSQQFNFFFGTENPFLIQNIDFAAYPLPPVFP
jgi:hypothetical protein